MLRNVNSTPPPNPEPKGPIGLETSSSLSELSSALVKTIPNSKSNSTLDQIPTSVDLLQKSIFSCKGVSVAVANLRASAFAPKFIGEIRVFIRKCFALFGFMQEV